MGGWPKQKSDRPSQNSLDLSVIFIANRQKDLKISKRATRILVKALLSYLEIPYEEIAIYFVSEKQIASLHDRFFQDPTPTDCISFPLDNRHLGEIFVCPAVAIRYAKKRGLDPYREMALYLIHGLLHLIGYSDLEKKEREMMRKKEKSCMRHLDRVRIKLQ